MLPKCTIRQILLTNHAWWHFYQANKHRLREGIVSCIVKLLSCRQRIRGYREYHCSNTACPHIKYICHTCKSRACSSCGKKATELWIKKQNAILPRTSWQHITFTMPDELWIFFWQNRFLLQLIAALAAKCIKKIASEKGVLPGIFIAIHTFGRDLKKNIHIHLSVTLGGISLDGKKWKKLFFRQNTLMKMWRYQVIQLFHEHAYHLVIPSALQKLLTDSFTFKKFLSSLYEKTWIVHCSPPSADQKRNVSYLGRYIKRPAIAESKLRHYDGSSVKFRYLDHASNTYRDFTLSVQEFIGRFVQHIPDKGFRLIRYYGFLSHRLRGKFLPLVYTLLGQNSSQETPPPTFSQLMRQSFQVDPLSCVLCGSQMALVAIKFGISKVGKLLELHQTLAQFQILRL